MLRRPLMTVSLAVLVLVGVSGCSDSPDPVSSSSAGSFSGSELASVALESDLRTEEVINQQIDQALNDTVTFNRTKSCPAGGYIEVSGTIIRTYDLDTTIMEADITGSIATPGVAFVSKSRCTSVNREISMGSS